MVMPCRTSTRSHAYHHCASPRPPPRRPPFRLGSGAGSALTALIAPSVATALQQPTAAAAAPSAVRQFLAAAPSQLSQDSLTTHPELLTVIALLLTAATITAILCAMAPGFAGFGSNSHSSSSASMGFGANPQGGVNLRSPPVWDPEQDHRYSFEQYCQDLML